MATYFLTKTIRINGHVVKVEELGYGDEKATLKEAEKVIAQLKDNGYKIYEKGDRIIATNQVDDQAIKCFISARELDGDKKRYVRKSVHKNGNRQTEVVFEGSKEECAIYVHREASRYAGLDGFDCVFNDAGSAHIEYVTKKGTKVKVNYLVKVAA